MVCLSPGSASSAAGGTVSNMVDRGMTPYAWSLLHPQIHDEVFKLKLIVKESRESIHPSYILEKLERILNGTPIALDPGKQAIFNQIKRGG